MSSSKTAAAFGALLAPALSALIWPAAARGADIAEDAEAASRPDIVVYGQHEEEANPNANPDAPYKVERSQNDKFTERLRDTPKTVVAIPKEVIEDLGATSFREVVRSTPRDTHLVDRGRLRVELHSDAEEWHVRTVSACRITGDQVATSAIAPSGLLVSDLGSASRPRGTPRSVARFGVWRERGR